MRAQKLRMRWLLPLMGAALLFGACEDDGNPKEETPSGNEQKPGDNTKPGDGDDTKPGDGDDTKPGDGDDTKPGDGDDTKPGDGDDTKPEKGLTEAQKAKFQAELERSHAACVDACECEDDVETCQDTCDVTRDEDASTMENYSGAFVDTCLPLMVDHQACEADHCAEEPGAITIACSDSQEAFIDACMPIPFDADDEEFQAGLSDDNRALFEGCMALCDHGDECRGDDTQDPMCELGCRFESATWAMYEFVLAEGALKDCGTNLTALQVCQASSTCGEEDASCTAEEEAMHDACDAVDMIDSL